MCGIFAYLTSDPAAVPPRERLDDTARALAHRGPDNTGVHTAPGIGLVHTRLTLLDLNPRSNQPLWDRSKRYALVYNGEVYNFQSIRAELEQHGIEFRTTSDTEVVLEALLFYGLEGAASKFEGMFAFALYDEVDGSICVGRDRFGIKPLFMANNADGFLLCSEVGGLRPWMPIEPDDRTVSSYLLGFSGPTRDFTFYKGIRFVPPGTIIKVRRGETPDVRSFFHITDFWDPEQHERLRHMRPTEVVDRIDELLHGSVGSQLVADVPVGAFCSGGVDSSLIMAMAAKHHSDLAVFHADVKGRLSEAEAARQLAAHLGLELKIVEARDEDFLRYLPEVTAHYGFPFSYHPNSVPFLMVSRLVRDSGVKAVLTGEGSDECFLGYPRLAIERFERFYGRVIDSARALIQRIPKVGTLLSKPPDNAHEIADGLHQRFEKVSEMATIRSETIGEDGRFHDLDVRTIDFLTYHLRTLLHRNDAMGMSASIEARFPFLDSELVRLAVNTPYNMKIRFSPTTLDSYHPFICDKWVLRQVADRYLPKSLSRRTKRGFPTSAFQRMRIADRYVTGTYVAELFELSQLQRKYLLDNADQRIKLRIMHLDVWWRVCVQNQSTSDVSRELLEEISFVPE
ncbi:MAG: asparagine synthase (glutamine-hydrolyzing) [Candidatus Latescibacterota bacterium]|nr:MAG: asparagine synthase (glutamine-hydrolyzing) [Candidatus Latescibacterota bacterium]